MPSLWFPKLPLFYTICSYTLGSNSGVSTPLIQLSIPVPVTHCFNCYTFVICFNRFLWNSPFTDFLFQESSHVSIPLNTEVEKILSSFPELKSSSLNLMALNVSIHLKPLNLLNLREIQLIYSYLHPPLKCNR